MLIRAFTWRFTLSEVAKKELVTMIRYFIPDKNKLPKSYKEIVEVIDEMGSTIQEIKYCSTCQSKIELECENESCSLKNKLQKNPDSLENKY